MTIAAITASQGVYVPEESPRRGSAVAAELRPHPPDVPFASLPSIPLVAVPQTATLGAMGKASPSQMFEPWIADASERRRAGMKSEVEPDQRASVYQQRFERKYVDASRAEGLNARQDRLGSPPTATSISHDQSLRTPGGAPSQKDTAGNIEPGPGADQRATRAKGNPESAVVIERDVQRPNGNNGISKYDGSSSPRTVHAAQSSPAPVPAGGRAGGGEDAQRVGRILAASRSNAIETIRTPASGPPPAGDRKAPSSSSSARHTGSSDQSGGPPGESRAGLIGRGARNEFDKLVRSLRLHVGARQSSAKIHLDPPELGRMFVDLRIKHGVVQISIRTETEHARALLNERAGQLRVALAQAGIHVDRLEVRADFAAEKFPAIPQSPFLLRGDEGGFDGGGGADLFGRSNPDVPGDRRNEGDVVDAGAESLLNGVGSVESEHDEVVLRGLERQLDLRI